MPVQRVTPILNVSDVAASLAWFESLGWKRTFTWNDGGQIDAAGDRNDHGPPNFAGLCSGHGEIFLCRDGQGAPGGMWMSWWMPSGADVDALYATARERGYETVNEPRNEPWGVREFHLRHPDGHTFRISGRP